jgi:hypothetical protein
MLFAPSHLKFQLRAFFPSLLWCLRRCSKGRKTLSNTVMWVRARQNPWQGDARPPRKSSGGVTLSPGERRAAWDLFEQKRAARDTVSIIKLSVAAGRRQQPASQVQTQTQAQNSTAVARRLHFERSSREWDVTFALANVYIYAVPEREERAQSWCQSQRNARCWKKGKNSPFSLLRHYFRAMEHTPLWWRKNRKMAKVVAGYTFDSFQWFC